MSERYPIQTAIEAGERVPQSISVCGVGLLGPDLASFRTILRLAVPLILSMSGLMIMMFLNRIFLSRCSQAQQALNAVGPAGMTCFLLMSVFIGAASFTSTFVAQYVGAGRTQRVGAAVWQGICFSLASGGVVAALSLLAEPLFVWVGHPPEVCELEIQYFALSCYAAPLSILGAAISGFYSGRGDTRTLMFAQLVGFAVNIFLDYALILGRCGFQEMGLVGAGLANIVSQGVIVLILLALFFLPRHIRHFGTWSGRGVEWPLFVRLIRFGLPNGLRFAIELLAWAMFLIFVGRLGEVAGAATNIAWVLNGFAFFPVIGLSEAIRTLVGQAQGQGRPSLATKVVWKGLLVGEIWMLTMAALYLVIPGPLLSVFRDSSAGGADQFAPVAELCVILLRFVALYCLLDGVNIVVMGALQGAGDTAWTLVVSVILHVSFLLALCTMDYLHGAGYLTGSETLYAEWISATAFVMVVALAWFARFLSGPWKHMKVIEQALDETPAAAEAKG